MHIYYGILYFLAFSYVREMTKNLMNEEMKGRRAGRPVIIGKGSAGKGEGRKDGRQGKKGIRRGVKKEVRGE